MEKIDTFINLEKKIWEAFINGNYEQDLRYLDNNFLGVYSSGYSNRTEHAEPLKKSPIAIKYEMSDIKLLHLADNCYLLAYYVEWVRKSNNQTEKMYVSSIWQKVENQWKNTFSQDSLCIKS